jgi:hypothetical protein
MKLAPLFACAVVLLPLAARAQYSNPYGVVAGTRVRILAPAHADQPLVGRLVAAAGDSLVFAPSTVPASARLPLGAAQGVAVSEGHDRLRSALLYGAVGGLGGGVLAAASFSEHDPLAGFVGFFAGAVLGAPIGGAVGAILAPERWRDVSGGTPASASTVGPYRIDVPRGTTVRVASRLAPDRRTTREVDTIMGDTLSFLRRGSDPSQVRLSDLARLEVRGGKDHRRGVLYGAAAFGIITGVAGGIDFAHDNISGGDLVGTALGNMLLGGLIGYALAPVGWEALPLPRR